MIHRSLFGRAAQGGRFSGLVGGAYGRCLTATNDTIPLLDFSYTSQSAADLGAAAHGPIKKWGHKTGFRATPRATASWAGLRDRYAQRGLSPVVRFGACSYAICMRSSHAMPCYAIGFAGLVLARSFGAQVNMIMANCQKIDAGGECGSTLVLLPLFFLPLFFLCSF